MSESEIRERIQEALSMIKSKLERDEGLRILEEVPMNLIRLYESGAGQKICRVFRSSRYYDRAQALHSKWISIAESELVSNWENVKHIWLSKTQIRELDRAQAKYDKCHKISKSNTDASPFPITPGRQRDDSLTDANTSFTREMDANLFPFNKENDRWFLDAVPRTPGAPRTPGRFDTDDSFDETILNSEGSTFSDLQLQFEVPERRQRGRPRKNATSSITRGGGTPRRGRRGRPPLNR